ncbi:MAG: DNA alkylation repair protein [Clostridia bacterium]
MKDEVLIKDEQKVVVENDDKMSSENIEESDDCDKFEKMVLSQLFKLQDMSYRDYTSVLVPNIDKSTIVGVQVPILCKFGKDILRDSNNVMGISPFLNKLPHKYYEENILHAYFIVNLCNFDELIFELDKFLPYVNNWAICDFIRPKISEYYLPMFIEKIKQWLQSSDTYTIRFGIEMLMKHYLGRNLKKEYLLLVVDIKSKEYYVKMMAAWYFATALATHYESVAPLLKQRKLDEWTQNKTIQKARDSKKIPPERKAELKTYMV